MTPETTLPHCLAFLASERRFVGWRWVQRPGKAKPDKVPFQPNGTSAKSNDPATWATLAEVEAARHSQRFDGVGIQLLNLPGCAALDLDNVRDPETGDVLPWARQLVEACGSYAEITPSGTGLRIIGAVTHNHTPMHTKRPHLEGGEVEFFVQPDTGRFITLTGNKLDAAPDRLAMIEGQIASVYAVVAPQPTPQLKLAPAETPAEVPDVSLVSDEQAIAFVRASEANRRNWDGDGVSDQSKAFGAVVGALARAGCSREQGKRLALASPLVVNGPPHSRGSRADKSAWDFDRMWPAAARRGAQERQEQAARTEHGRQSAEALLAGWNGAQGAVQVPSVDTGWFIAADFAREAVPPRDELVAGVIPMGNVSSLTGDGGTGKSTVMRQLANSVATGTAWFGMDVRSGPVIYLSAEDDRDELHRSFRNIGVTQNMGRLHLRSLAGADALLAVPRDRSGVLMPTQLFAELDAKIAETGAVAVFIDNAADAFGGNENDRAQVRQFISMLRGLAVRHRCAVVLLSHPSVAGMASGTGSSGSTAWNNSVRSRLYLSRVIGKDGDEANPNARTLTVKKNNYGPVGQQIVLTWRDGIFVSVDMPTGEARTAKAAYVFMKLLEQFSAQGRRVNTSGGAQYAPKAFAEHPEADGVTKAAFKAAMEMLLSKGAIALVETGPASKRRSHLMAADGLPTPFQPQNGLFQPPSDPSSNPVPTPFQPLPPPLPSNPL